MEIDLIEPGLHLVLIRDGLYSTVVMDLSRREREKYSLGEALEAIVREMEKEIEAAKAEA